MIGTLLALAVAAQPAAASPDDEISITTYEPVSPDSAEQALTVRCGNQTLRIAGYGFSRPEGRLVTLTVNGRNVSNAEDLQRDLSNGRAVYRLYATCSQLTPHITVGIRVLEGVNGGQVIIHSARASFRGAVLEYYSGLQLGTLDDFSF